MEARVKERQSLLDMAIQSAGSMEAAFRLCETNNIGLTDILQDGQVLEKVAVESADTVRRYSIYDIQPATALDEEDMALSQEGIGFMGIEIDFTVS